MKICVSSGAPGLDAPVDPRFGRCQYFTIIDPDTMQYESFDNAAMGASGGAGIQAAQLIANRGVEVVLTGNVGPNAYTTLQSAGIKIITGVSGKVSEVVEAYKKGTLGAPVSGPTVGDHFGAGEQPQIPTQNVGMEPAACGRGMGMGRGRGGGDQGGGMGRGRK